MDYCYKIFLDRLEYDQEYARSKYDDWCKIVYDMFCSKYPVFVLAPDAFKEPHNKIIDFFEFIDGNGFEVDYRAGTPMRVEVRKKSTLTF